MSDKSKEPYETKKRSSFSRKSPSPLGTTASNSLKKKPSCQTLSKTFDMSTFDTSRNMTPVHYFCWSCPLGEELVESCSDIGGSQITHRGWSLVLRVAPGAWWESLSRRDSRSWGGDWSFYSFRETTVYGWFLLHVRTSTVLENCVSESYLNCELNLSIYIALPQG